MTVLTAPTSTPATGTAPSADASARLARLARLAPVGRRLAAAALLGGAALNTSEALLQRAVTSGGQGTAARLADVDAAPVGTAAMIALGTLAVPLMLVGFQAVAHLVRPRAPRLAAAGAVLTFVGCFGFFGMHVGMLMAYAAAGLHDRAAAVAVLDGVQEHPAGLLLLVPFLLGLFPGLLLLVLGLWRARVVPRWVPLVWAAFLVLDLVAAGAMPVDPHWLFLAGAAGTAAAVLRTPDDVWSGRTA